MSELLRKILLSALVVFGVWLGGLLWFMMQIPTENEPLPQADCIIVLTGSKGRLEYGLELLAQGKARVAFISGVGKDVTEGDLLHKAAPDVRKKIASLPADALVLGRDAENTIGNAEETARWAEKQKPVSLLLVTANYHMPRSVSEFQELLPQVKIIPAPVFADNLSLALWWLNADTRTLVLSEYHKYLASKLRHWML